MAEIRRTTATVEALEKTVAELVATSKTAHGETVAGETASKFADADKQFTELIPLIDKMRKRCEARADLEAVKVQLSQQLPGSAPDNALKSAQELLNPPVLEDAEGDATMSDATEVRRELTPAESIAIKALVQRAEELEGLATYGVKMAEKVCDLLVRFDTTSALFSSEVVPHFGAAVAEMSAGDAERKVEAERQAVALAAEEKRLADEERRQKAEAMAADSERRLQAHQEIEAAEKRKLEEEAAAKRKADAASAAEEEEILRAQAEEEQRMAEVGPDQACSEALALMLKMPVGIYREAVEALHAMLGGIASEPEDTKLRIVRLANEGFQKQLGRRPGCWLFLRAVGFTPTRRDALPAGLLASVAMVGGPPSERFLWLQEPNMMNEFDVWEAWHSRIKVVAQFCQALERLAFQRTSHLGRHGQDTPAQAAVSVGEVARLWQAR